MQLQLWASTAGAGQVAAHRHLCPVAVSQATWSAQGASPGLFARPLPGRCHRQRAPPLHTVRQPAAGAAAVAEEPQTYAAEPTPQQHEQVAEDTEHFNWFKQWWPLYVIEHLDPRRPNTAQLLGRELVIWRDAGGTWRAFEDKCPHRAAPLSEGRLEPRDGTLMCAYHGWRFAGDGRVARLPQADGAEQHNRILSSPLACAAAFPTQARGGLLWVWADSGPAALIDSAMRQPAIPPELDGPRGEEKGRWHMRDLPYGWDVFFENLVDPTHVVVAHSGIVGHRDDAAPYDMVQVRPESAQGGFSYARAPTYTGTAFNDTATDVTTSFQPPCLVRVHSGYDCGAALDLILFGAPSKPGWTRHMGCTLVKMPDDPNAKAPLSFGPYLLPMPRWLHHLLSAEFYHGDQVFLHGQGARMSRPGADWKEEYFMPTTADKMVRAFRNWFTVRAGGAIPWPAHTRAALAAGGIAREPERRVLLDRYEQHTKNCRYCKGAVRNIRVLKWVAAATAVAGLARAALTHVLAKLGHHVPLASQHVTDKVAHSLVPHPVAWLVIGAAAAAAAVGLAWLQRAFYYRPFHHADLK